MQPHSEDKTETALPRNARCREDTSAGPKEEGTARGATPSQVQRPTTDYNQLPGADQKIHVGAGLAEDRETQCA